MATATSLGEKMLFPGCVIPNRLPYIEAASRKALERLGYKLIDMNGASCCPDPVGMQALDQKTWLAMGARNLTIAEAAKKNVISLCNGCTETLRSVNHFLNHDLHLYKEVNAILKEVGKEYRGTVDVQHVVAAIYYDIGVEKLRTMVQKPLTRLKIATHHGCHFNRPTHIVDPEGKLGPWDNPTMMDEMLEALGATVIDYDERYLCCGYAVTLAESGPTEKLDGIKFKSLIAAGADYLCVACPSCYLQLEGVQRTLKKNNALEKDIPILYFTELLALALGFGPDEIGLGFHAVKPKDIIEQFK